jgi:T-complex protein 1 subunit zeta
MQIRHPTAAMIARAATAQDSIVGDGTTSNILVIGDLLKQAERLIQDGIHPRIIADGYEKGKVQSLKFLDGFRTKDKIDTSLLRHVAKTSLSTKLQPKHANMLVDIIVKSVETVK